MAEADDVDKLRRKEASANIARRRHQADVAWVLASIEGRRFYWDLMIKCGVFRSSFTGNNSTFFNEGERNIGLIMLADMNEADPQAYLKCLTETKKQEASNG